MDYWLEENLFTLGWWFLIISTITLLGIWLLMLDKKNIMEILTYGLMLALTTYVLDCIGSSFMLWEYPNKILPVMPPIIEIHTVHLPISYMLIYQYFTRWKPFIIALTIVSFVFAFILEPITEWLNIYEMYKWKHIYSFPFYIGLGLFFKWLIIKLKQISIENGHV